MPDQLSDTKPADTGVTADGTADTAAAGTKLIDKARAINWNRIDEQIDLDAWQRQTSNFWLPEKIPLSNDLPSWSALRSEERRVGKECRIRWGGAPINM